MFYPPMSCFHAVDGVVEALTKFNASNRENNMTENDEAWDVARTRVSENSRAGFGR